MLNHDEFPYHIFNTHKSYTRDDALHEITTNMKKSGIYEPLGYIFDESGCSCCLSEYFYLIYKCKIRGDTLYKVCSYHGTINHTNDCYGSRCSCFQYFIWKNINPNAKVQTFKDGYEDELNYCLEKYISLKENDDWKNDYCLFLQQQKENEEIQKYIEEKENEEKENEENYLYQKLKNYSYYFSPLSSFS